VIAREHDVAAGERQAQVIGGVPWRMDRGQRPVGAGDRVAAFRRDVGLEIVVDEIAA